MGTFYFFVFFLDWYFSLLHDCVWKSDNRNKFFYVILVQLGLNLWISHLFFDFFCDGTDMIKFLFFHPSFSILLTKCISRCGYLTKDLFEHICMGVNIRFSLSTSLLFLAFNNLSLGIGLNIKLGLCTSWCILFFNAFSWDFYFSWYDWFHWGETIREGFYVSIDLLFLLYHLQSWSLNGLYTLFFHRGIFVSKLF